MSDSIKDFIKLVESIQNEAPTILDEETKQSIVRSYIYTALWSSNDTIEGEDVSLENFVMADECKKALTVKAYDFINKHEQLINDFMEEESVDAGQVGHTLWLATNGHGSGFFDFNGVAAEELNKICASVKQTDLYVGDDNLVYCSGGVVTESESYHETIWVCSDCAPVIANDDYSHLSNYETEEEVDRRLEEINNGIADLIEGGKQLIVGEETNEFSKSPCECCGEKLAGSRCQVTVFKK